MERLYSVQEASLLLGLSEQHVRYLLAKGQIKGRKLGRDWAVLSLDYTKKRKLKVRAEQ
jgi:excisionase family DNA binding protein